MNLKLIFSSALKPLSLYISTLVSRTAGPQFGRGHKDHSGVGKGKAGTPQSQVHDGDPEGWGEAGESQRQRFGGRCHRHSCCPHPKGSMNPWYEQMWLDSCIVCELVYRMICCLSCQIWKGYIQRKKTRKEREEEMIFLGMVSQTWVCYLFLSIWGCLFCLIHRKEPNGHVDQVWGKRNWMHLNYSEITTIIGLWKCGSNTSYNNHLIISHAVLYLIVVVVFSCRWS